MSILSAQSIRKRVQSNSLKIEPFSEPARAHGRSYGLSSCGYDLRLAEDILLWPFWGRLGSVIEYIEMPDDLRGKIENKSTNARIFVNAAQGTNIEPGWSGYLTVELTRFLPWPVRLKKGTPIVQVVFELLDEPTEMPYRGKYNGQSRGPQAALFEADIRP